MADLGFERVPAAALGRTEPGAGPAGSPGRPRDGGEEGPSAGGGGDGGAARPLGARAAAMVERWALAGGDPSLLPFRERAGGPLDGGPGSGPPAALRRVVLFLSSAGHYARDAGSAGGDGALAGGQGQRGGGGKGGGAGGGEGGPLLGHHATTLALLRAAGWAVAEVRAREWAGLDAAARAALVRARLPA
jgi:hypothetical protein